MRAGVKWLVFRSCPVIVDVIPLEPMATTADEFDPPKLVFNAIVRESLLAVLVELADEIGTPFIAKLSVWVDQKEIFKSFLTERGYLDSDQVDENTNVRIRCRKTYRNDRFLFSIETQHAEIWRKSGFSGVRIRGDVVTDDTGVVKSKIKDKTICYNSGWIGW